LGNNVLSYLVGRVSATKLFPFSLHEILRAKKLKEMIEKIRKDSLGICQLRWLSKSCIGRRF